MVTLPYAGMVVMPADAGGHRMTIDDLLMCSTNNASHLTEKLQAEQGKRRFGGGQRLDNFASLGYWQMDEEERKGP